jgi:aryl-alcohol dehydrogenase-like predicted oxidoreductase
VYPGTNRWEECDAIPKTSDMVDIALKFVLANPAVTCAIPGIKTPLQAQQNAAAADGGIDVDILEKIRRICLAGQ